MTNDSQGTSNHIRVAFSEITQPDKNEEHEKDGLKIIGMFFFSDNFSLIFKKKYGFI